MKNIFLVIFLLLIIGCSNSDVDKPYIIPISDLSIKGKITIDGCEYFIVRTYMYNIPLHKGNCKNPIHHHILDSTKYIQKIELDSMKINLLEQQIKILEKTNKQLFYQLKSKNNEKN